MCKPNQAIFVMIIKNIFKGIDVKNNSGINSVMCILGSLE